LLPLHIHSSTASLVLLALLVFAGRRTLVGSLHVMGAQWRQATALHPVISFLAVAVVGFAAVFTWLPSLNPDDNAAHLLLGNQLLADGYFHLDASTQISSVSPWFNNAIQGLLQLVSGAEARSGTGLLWLLFGAAGAFRLAKALRADDATALLAMAVYASHPLTAYYGTTLQVDGASAACLLHLATLCIGVQRNDDEAAVPLLVGVLCGILAAMKITNLVYLGFIGPWLLWRYASRGQASRILMVVGAAALVAGSSYFYATVVTGNPLFPMYNGIFKSPYMPPVNFADARWHAGFGPKVLWDLTFASGEYMEAYTGAAGLALLALAGASLVALLSGGWRAGLTLLAMLAGAVVFSQVQYLRYVFPAMALAGTVAVVVFFSLGQRRIGLGLMAVFIVAQLGLVNTSNWILNAGVAEQMLTEGPASVKRIEDRFVPERAMVRQLAARKDRFCLLLAEPMTAYVALAPGRSLTTAFYDSRMNALAQWANQDASGARWRQNLNSIGVTDVELRPAMATPALLAALSAEKFATSDTGEAQLWSREGQSPEQCLGGLLQSRDEARRMFH
jgi:4-amino-4-deoxy-L-arabinose transferase-like glycosyltransferase